jgi:hypothetical protein
VGPRPKSLSVCESSSGSPSIAPTDRAAIVGDRVSSPNRRIITHVVVEPRHKHHLARLVPIAEVSGGSTRTALRLRCTAADLERFPEVEETAYARLGEWPAVQDEDWEVGLSRVLALPVLGTAGGPGCSEAAERHLVRLLLPRLPSETLNTPRSSGARPVRAGAEVDRPGGQESGV